MGLFVSTVLVLALLVPALPSHLDAVTAGNVQASTATVQGVDVSHYQLDIGWSEVYNSGKRFAFVKATEGQYDNVITLLPKGVQGTILENVNNGVSKHGHNWWHVRFTVGYGDLKGWLAQDGLTTVSSVAYFKPGDKVVTIDRYRLRETAEIPGTDDGVDYGVNDDRFVENMYNARAADILAGAYHFARPNLTLDGEELLNNAKKEAEHFWRVARNYLAGGYLQPALDIEFLGISYGTGWGSEQIKDEEKAKVAELKFGENSEQNRQRLSEWIRQWITIVEDQSAAPVRPILYVNSNIAADYLKADVARYDLWIAQYTSATEPDIGVWTDWAFWQYSKIGSVDGVTGDVDLDLFNGNESDLHSKFVIPYQKALKRSLVSTPVYANPYVRATVTYYPIDNTNTTFQVSEVRFSSLGASKGWVEFGIFPHESYSPPLPPLPGTAMWKEIFFTSGKETVFTPNIVVDRADVMALSFGGFAEGAFYFGAGPVIPLLKLTADLIKNAWPIITTFEPVATPTLSPPSTSGSPESLFVSQAAGNSEPLLLVQGGGFSPKGQVDVVLLLPDNTEKKVQTLFSDDAGQVEIVLDTLELATGTYQLWAVDTISGRRSNTISFTLSPPSGVPDLTVTSVTAPLAARAGDTIPVGFTVKNVGDASSAPFDNLVSLATSPWGTQIPLRYVNVGSIGPDISLSSSTEVSIPSSVLPGQYWVTVYANPGEASESRSDNNINKAASQIKIVTSSETDVTHPSVALAGPIAGETWVAGMKKAIQWSAKDNVGVTSVDLYFTSDGWRTSQEVATPIPGANSQIWPVPQLNTTEAQFMVVAWDAADNAGIDISGKFSITDTLTLLEAPTLYEPNILGNSSYNVSWSIVDRAATYILQEGNDSSFSNLAEYPVAQTSKNFVDRPTGIYYYRVAAVDSHGLKGAWSQTKSVTLQGDLGPGEITLTTPSDNAPGQPLTVTLQWSATHPTGEKLTYDVFLMPFDSDALYSAHIVSPGQLETSYTAANLDYNKKYSWGIRAWDETGQNRASDVYHFTTVGDASPPTGSISINNGAATTDTYAVTLYLSASDTESGVQYMRFSNDGEHWMTNWEWFSPRYPWNIADSTYGGKPNQDVYTVYAQFRDTQGNESTKYWDTITKAKAKPGNIILNGVYYETIRDAVAAAQSGDTVYLTDGTYTIYGQNSPPRYPSSSVGIVLKPGVTLKGAGADRTKVVLEQGLWTIIDADNSTIEGLTIIMAQPNVVRYAVLLESNSSKISNSIVQSTYGGIEIRGSNNLVANNLIKDSGDGININLGTNSRIYNNTIVNNSGNGIVSQDTAAQIKNNIIANNNNYGVYVQATTDFKNNDVYGNFKNYPTDTGWLQDQTGKNGNISADPFLTSDYRLNSGSPAVNTGINVGLPFSGGAPDMGAFEYGATGTIRVVSNHDQATFTIFGPQNYSGTGKTWSVSGAPIGVYSVTFVPVSQHYTPPYETMALMSNETIDFDGTYQMDTIPPSGSLALDFDEYATSDNMATITLSFADAVAGMGPGAQMVFSNDSTNWSAPEPFSTLRKGWDLTAYGGNTTAGLKTVYAKVSDALGNWMTIPASDSILYVPGRTILEVPTQYSTIQAAIDAAEDGDVVHVLPGDYRENVVLKSGVRLQGSGSDVTSLSWATGNPVITAAFNSTIDGFTINKVPLLSYQGILVRDASPIISNNVIRAARGIEIQGDSKPVIWNNVIKDSSQIAIFVTSGTSSAVIENNTIVANKEGIYLNSAIPNTRVYVINNIIVNNGASGITDTNTADTAHKHMFSSFNLFWQNAGGNFAGYDKDKISGAGDFDADPLFTDAASQDFTLRNGSPAINSGHPEERYNDADGTRNDRGAYGGPTANTRPKAGLVANPVIGGLDTLFTFDAGTSHDFESEDEALLVRWDFDGDGIYDTGFQTEKKVGYNFGALGEYTVTVQARDKGGFLSTASKTVAVLNQSPLTPSNPTPNDNSMDQPLQVTLGWTGGDPDPGDAVNYDVYFGPSTDPPLVVSGQTTTTYVPGNLQYHTFYYWKIVSTDSAGISVSSPVWSFLTELEPIPGSPSGLMATTISRSQIDLEWLDNSNNEIGFKIERKIGEDDPYTLIEVLPSDSVRFADSNLVQGTTYYYKVSAYNSTGTSVHSNEASAITPSVLTKSSIFLTGWNMFSVPLDIDPADWATQLGDDFSPLYVYHYDAVAHGYKMYPSSPFAIQRGWGYWLKALAATAVDIEGLIAPATPFSIHLLPGWMQIGHPFDFPVSWSEVQVRNTATGEVVSIEQAHLNGWVQKYLYSYDPGIGGYHMDTAPEGVLTPWLGYWVKALVEADLIIPATPVT